MIFGLKGTEFTGRYRVRRPGRPGAAASATKPPAASPQQRAASSEQRPPGQAAEAAAEAGTDPTDSPAGREHRARHSAV